MDTSIKLAAAAIGLFLAVINCNAQTRAIEAPKTAEIDTYSQKTLLKNWALDSCMSSITKNKEDYDDIGVALGGFFQFGKQHLEVYRTLGTFAEKYAKRKYSSTNGLVKSDFNVMKCMDMYHSKELDRLIAKLVKIRYKY